jgi:hypothetical protein
MTMPRSEETVVLMREIMDRLGTPTTAALTERLMAEGLVSYTESRKVARWVSGENTPDGLMTMKLLRLAGMVRRD